MENLGNLMLRSYRLAAAFQRCVLFLSPLSFFPAKNAGMTVEAHITPVWKKQKLLLALLLLGFGAWFVFDGLIGWPKSNDRWREHERLKGQAGKWEEVAKQNNWSTEPPHRLYEYKDILGQYIIGGLCAALGLGALIYWRTQINRTLRMDDDGVTTTSGVRVPFPAIIGVGKKLWESKGIAKVRYTLDGKQCEFIVDDYKFDTKPTRQILEEIEKRLLSKS